MRRGILFAAALMAALMFLGSGCNLEDPRVLGWNRYTDEADGYEILVPPEWAAEDEMMADMRGTRLYPTDVTSPPLAGNVYYSIYVRDLAPEDGTLADRARPSLDALLKGLWCNVEAKREEGDLNGVAAVRFTVEGDSCASGVRLNAIVVVLHHGNREFVLFASATRESYPRLEERLMLIHSSFKLPPE